MSIYLHNQHEKSLSFRYISLIDGLTKRYLNRKEDEITNEITNEAMNHLKDDLKKKLLDQSVCVV